MQQVKPSIPVMERKHGSMKLLAAVLVRVWVIHINCRVVTHRHPVMVHNAQTSSSDHHRTYFIQCHLWLSCIQRYTGVLIIWVTMLCNFDFISIILLHNILSELPCPMQTQTCTRTHTCAQAYIHMIRTVLDESNKFVCGLFLWKVKSRRRSGQLEIWCCNGLLRSYICNWR